MIPISSKLYCWKTKYLITSQSYCLPLYSTIINVINYIACVNICTTVTSWSGFGDKWFIAKMKICFQPWKLIFPHWLFLSAKITFSSNGANSCAINWQYFGPLYDFATSYEGNYFISGQSSQVSQYVLKNFSCHQKSLIIKKVWISNSLLKMIINICIDLAYNLTGNSYAIRDASLCYQRFSSVD